MLILAVAYLPIFIVGYLPDVPPDVKREATLMGRLIIGLFAAELAVKLVCAERRIDYLRSRWLDVLIVLLPFLRPLRILLFLPFLMRAIVGLERILGPYRAAYVGVVGVLTIFTGAGVALLFEDRGKGPIQSYGDALWWSMSTITTVGYGDTYPVTVGGKIIAALLMVVGIALFGVLTAGIAAYFVESSGEREQERQADKLDLLLRRLDEIEKLVGEQADRRPKGGDRGR